MLSRFLGDRGGNFGVMTAILMVPLIGAAGLALDFSHALAVRTHLQGAADAAALAAVSEQSQGVREALRMTRDGEIPIAADEALRFFQAQFTDAETFILDSLDIKVIRKNNRIESAVSFKATIPTTLSRILGKDLIQVAGQATAEYQTQTFRDFYLLLDNTPSMGVGATPADVARMVANTPDQCAFACHIVRNGVEDKSSYYNLAKKLGVTTRINVVAQATAALIDTASQSRTSSNQYRMALYTFGERAEDTKLLEVARLTTDLTSAKRKAAEVDLMSIPFQGYDNDQQTDFDRALKQIGEKMGPAGSGLTAGSPEKVLFFVSDGVGDSYKPSNCTKKTTNGRCQEPIDVRHCTSLKDKGYRIAVLYTTYLPLPTNDWYNSWIRPFQSEIATRMKECASPDLFFEVSPTEGIADAMTALFKRIVNSPRLTS